MLNGDMLSIYVTQSMGQERKTRHWQVDLGVNTG